MIELLWVAVSAIGYMVVAGMTSFSFGRLTQVEQDEAVILGVVWPVALPLTLVVLLLKSAYEKGRWYG